MDENNNYKQKLTTLINRVKILLKKLENYMGHRTIVNSTGSAIGMADVPIVNVDGLHKQEVQDKISKLIDKLNYIDVTGSSVHDEKYKTIYYQIKMDYNEIIDIIKNKNSLNKLRPYITHLIDADDGKPRRQPLRQPLRQPPRRPLRQPLRQPPRQPLRQPLLQTQTQSNNKTNEIYKMNQNTKNNDELLKTIKSQFDYVRGIGSTDIFSDYEKLLLNYKKIGDDKKKTLFISFPIIIDIMNSNKEDYDKHFKKYNECLKRIHSNNELLRHFYDDKQKHLFDKNKYPYTYGIKIAELIFETNDDDFKFDKLNLIPLITPDLSKLDFIPHCNIKYGNHYKDELADYSFFTIFKNDKINKYIQICKYTLSIMFDIVCYDNFDGISNYIVDFINNITDKHDLNFIGMMNYKNRANNVGNIDIFKGIQVFDKFFFHSIKYLPIDNAINEYVYYTNNMNLPIEKTQEYKKENKLIGSWQIKFIQHFFERYNSFIEEYKYSKNENVLKLKINDSFMNHIFNVYKNINKTYHSQFENICFLFYMLFRNYGDYGFNNDLKESLDKKMYIFKILCKYVLKENIDDSFFQDSFVVDFINETLNIYSSENKYEKYVNCLIIFLVSDINFKNYVCTNNVDPNKNYSSFMDKYKLICFFVSYENNLIILQNRKFTTFFNEKSGKESSRMGPTFVSPIQGSYCKRICFNYSLKYFDEYNKSQIFEMFYDKNIVSNIGNVLLKTFEIINDKHITDEMANMLLYQYKISFFMNYDSTHEIFLKINEVIKNGNLNDKIKLIKEIILFYNDESFKISENILLIQNNKQKLCVVDKKPTITASIFSNDKIVTINKKNDFSRNFECYNNVNEKSFVVECDLVKNLFINSIKTILDSVQPPTTPKGNRISKMNNNILNHSISKLFVFKIIINFVETVDEERINKIKNIVNCTFDNYLINNHKNIRYKLIINNSNDLFINIVDYISINKGFIDYYNNICLPIDHIINLPSPNNINNNIFLCKLNININAYKDVSKNIENNFTIRGDFYRHISNTRASANISGVQSDCSYKYGDGKYDKLINFINDVYMGNQTVSMKNDKFKDIYKNNDFINMMRSIGMKITQNEEYKNKTYLSMLEDLTRTGQNTIINDKIKEKLYNEIDTHLFNKEINKGFETKMETYIKENLFYLLCYFTKIEVQLDQQYINKNASYIQFLNDYNSIQTTKQHLITHSISTDEIIKDNVGSSWIKSQNLTDFFRDNIKLVKNVISFKNFENLFSEEIFITQKIDGSALSITLELIGDKYIITEIRSKEELIWENDFSFETQQICSMLFLTLGHLPECMNPVELKNLIYFIYNFSLEFIKKLNLILNTNSNNKFYKSIKNNVNNNLITKIRINGEAFSYIKQSCNDPFNSVCDATPSWHPYGFKIFNSNGTTFISSLDDELHEIFSSISTHNFNTKQHELINDINYLKMVPISFFKLLSECNAKKEVCIVPPPLIKFRNNLKNYEKNNIINFVDCIYNSYSQNILNNELKYLEGFILTRPSDNISIKIKLGKFNQIGHKFYSDLLDTLLNKKITKTIGKDYCNGFRYEVDYQTDNFCSIYNLMVTNNCYDTYKNILKVGSNIFSDKQYNIDQRNVYKFDINKMMDKLYNKYFDFEFYVDKNKDVVFLFLGKKITVKYNHLMELFSSDLSFNDDKNKKIFQDPHSLQIVNHTPKKHTHPNILIQIMQIFPNVNESNYIMFSNILYSIKIFIDNQQYDRHKVYLNIMTNNFLIDDMYNFYYKQYEKIYYNCKFTLFEKLHSQIIPFCSENDIIQHEENGVIYCTYNISNQCVVDKFIKYKCKDNENNIQLFCKGVEITTSIKSRFNEIEITQIIIHINKTKENINDEEIPCSIHLKDKKYEDKQKIDESFKIMLDKLQPRTITDYINKMRTVCGVNFISFEVIRQKIDNEFKNFYTLESLPPIDISGEIYKEQHYIFKFNSPVDINIIKYSKHKCKKDPIVFKNNFIRIHYEEKNRPKNYIYIHEDLPKIVKKIKQIELICTTFTQIPKSGQIYFPYDFDFERIKPE